MRHTYGIVGDGKLAHHLSRYLSLKQLSIEQWSRRKFALDRLPPAAALASSDVILIMVTDSAIEGCIRDLQTSPTLASRTVVHFSGALSTYLATGFHPLMTFGTNLYDLAVYESIPFVCDSDGCAFQDVFPTLPNPTYTLPPVDKALYHSLCVLAGNCSVILWQKLFTELEERFSIPHTAAVPYLNQITSNLSHDFHNALTGPLIRRDHVTLCRNEAALQGDPFQAIYKCFVSAFSGGGSRERT